MPGNTGRLLDARRTPTKIVGLNLAEGTFEVEIQAFEDRGARWWVPIEDVAKYQFAPDSRTAEDSTVKSHERAARTFDRPLVIEAQASARAQTLRRLRAQRTVASEWLDREGLATFELPPRIAAREGDARLAALLSEYLARHELLAMDLAFSQAFVSNPAAG